MLLLCIVGLAAARGLGPPSQLEKKDERKEEPIAFLNHRAEKKDQPKEPSLLTDRDQYSEMVAAATSAKEEFVQRMMQGPQSQQTQAQSSSGLAQPVEAMSVDQSDWWSDSWLRMGWKALKQIEEDQRKIMKEAAQNPTLTAKQAACSHPMSRRAKGGNQYGHWNKCTLCNVRLQYETRHQHDKEKSKRDKQMDNLYQRRVARSKPLSQEESSLEWEVLEEMAEGVKNRRRTAAKSNGKERVGSTTAPSELQQLTEAIKQMALQQQQSHLQMTQLAQQNITATEGLRKTLNDTVGAALQARQATPGQ